MAYLKSGLDMILRSALRQNDTKLYELVCDTLMLLGTLKERDIQDVAIGCLDCP